MPTDVWTWVGLAAAALAVAGAAVAFVYLFQARRNWGAPLQKLAERNQWKYESEGPERLLERFGRFGPLRAGRPERKSFVNRPNDAPTGQRTVRHVITGRLRNSHFHLFEYDWELPPTKRRPDEPVLRRHALVAFRMVEAPAGLRVLRRDRRAGTRNEAVRQGPSDVQLGDRRLERRFRVLCADKPFASRVLYPAIRRFLVRSRLDWEWKGRWLVVHWDGRLKSPDVLRGLRAVVRFVERLPDDLRPPALTFQQDEPDEEAAAV